jgi:hypothetical protein
MWGLMKLFRKYLAMLGTKESKMPQVITKDPELSVQFICPFLTGLFVLLLFSFLSSVYILTINPLSVE